MEEDTDILANKANTKKFIFAWLKVIWTARKVQIQEKHVQHWCISNTRNTDALYS